MGIKPSGIGPMFSAKKVVNLEEILRIFLSELEEFSFCNDPC